MTAKLLPYDRFADLTRYHARVRPNATALIFEDRRQTWAELDRNTSRIANALLAHCPEKFSRVAYLGTNSDRFFEIYFGAAKALKIVVPINWRLTPHELAYILKDSAPTLVFVEAQFADNLREALAIAGMQIDIVRFDDDAAYLGWRNSVPDTDPALQTSPDDVHIILYTSGTTGHPKGAMLTNRSEFALRTLDAGLDPAWWHQSDQDVTLCNLPIFHLSGSSWSFMNIYHGGTLVIQPRASAEGMLDAIARHGVTHIQTVPALLQMMLDLPECDGTDLSHMRMIFYGGSPIALPLLKRVISRLNVGLFQMYGMTECSGYVGYLGPRDHLLQDEAILQSCGKPYPHVDIQVMDDQGGIMPDGEVGELCIRTPGLMAGYWNKPEVLPSLMHGEYYRSGDAGWRDERGYFYIVDRVKDMIVSGGENIYPAEIERVLHMLPGVRDLAVIGVADAKWGESVKAIIVRDDPHLTEADVERHARQYLAGYKIPRSVTFVDELPRNPSGKILKRILRDQYAKAPVA